MPPPVGTWAALSGTSVYPAIPFEAKPESAPGGTPELWSPQSLFAYSGGEVAQRGGVWGFLIWGGGHAATPDNSLYWVPFDGSGAQRLTGPYLAPDKAYTYDLPYETYRDVSRNVTGVTTPGAPKSRHTYSSLVWTGSELLAFGGSLHTGAGGGTEVIRRFDLSQTAAQAMARADMGWQLRAPAPAGTITAMAGWDSQTGKYVVRARNFFGAYLPATNTWERWGDAGGGSDYEASVAMDVFGRRMYILGSRLAEVINLDAHTLTPITAAWAAPFLPASPEGPGIAWHAGTRQIIAWLGGQNLLLIDPSLGTSRTVTMSGLAVSAAQGSGTYGRFRVIPGTDQVVLVNSVFENVFIGTVPVGAWREHSMPPAGLAYMGGQGGKHGRTFYHALSHEMVFAGGDWKTSQPTLENGDFVGSEIWALDVAVDTWRLLRPFCVAGEPQPGRPDSVGWAHDSQRDRALMTPGFYGITQGATSGCGATEGWGGYAFSFATRKFSGPDALANLPPPPSGWGGDTSAAFSTYDPVNDELVRVRNGPTLERLNLATQTWRTKNLGLTPTWNPVPNRAQIVIDAAGRAVYWLDAFGDAGGVAGGVTTPPRGPALIKVSLIDGTVTPILLPSSYVPPGDGSQEVYLAFDPINRLVMIPNNTGMGQSPILGLGLYHADTGIWEWQPVPSWVWGSVWGFDEATGQLIGIGKRTIPTAYYTYRYAAPIIPNPAWRVAQTLTLTVT
jgi:hypothetical protein